METLHAPIGMGRPALAAAVPYPGKVTWISHKAQGSTKKKKKNVLMVVTGLNWILPPKLSCFCSPRNRWKPDWLGRLREGVPGQVSQQFQDCCQVPGPDRADKEGGPHQAVWEWSQDTVHLSAWECSAPPGLQHWWPLAVPGEYVYCLLSDIFTVDFYTYSSVCGNAC